MAGLTQAPRLVVLADPLASWEMWETIATTSGDKILLSITVTGGEEFGPLSLRRFP